MSQLPPRQVAGTSAFNGPHGNGLTAISQQDSTHFGLSIARNPHLTREGIEAADAFCRRENVALFIVRCPTTDTNSLLVLQDNGYRIVDTLVHWRRRLVNDHQHVAKQDVLVRRVGVEDTVSVAAIARTAFNTYNGHYHADVRLPIARSTDVYVSWASRACAETDVDNIVLGAEWQGSLAGFVALKRARENVWDVPLAAVAPEAQGRGLLTSLLAAAMREAYLRDGEFLEYGCILSNIGAQKALVRLGFEIYASYHTLHKWFQS